MKRSFRYYSYLIHVALPFSIGCLLYAIGRTLSLIKIGEQLKIDNKVVLVPLPKWAVFNLPDGLWLYSFFMWLILTWHRQKNRESFIWYGVLTALAFGSELLQKYSLIQGTFDTSDMVAYFIAILFCLRNYYHLNILTK